MEQYSVTGMSCAACSSRVEKAVSKVPGVTSCSVSLLTNSMGVRIKTQGTAELKFGATMKNIDNPSLPIRNRKTTNIDFDERGEAIALHLHGVHANVDQKLDVVVAHQAASAPVMMPLPLK